MDQRVEASHHCRLLAIFHPLTPVEPLARTIIIRRGLHDMIYILGIAMCYTGCVCISAH